MRSDRTRNIEAVTAVLLSAGLAVVVKSHGSPPGSSHYADRDAVSLSGRFRDFDASHPDFNASAVDGAGRYVHIFGDQLDDQSKPEFLSSGRRVEQFARDNQGRDIMAPRWYIDGRSGDQQPRVSGVGEGGAASSRANEWFRDGAGMNVSEESRITLSRVSGTDRFIFDGPLDQGGSLESAMTPSGATHFTHELVTTFIYEEGQDWYLETSTDGEAWVYINDKLVIDGGASGGTGGAIEFTIDSDGSVTPSVDYSVEVTVLGAAIQTGSYHRPVTMRLQVGSEMIDAFGDASLPVDNNLNDEQTVTGWANPGANPRRYVYPSTFSANTPIDVIGYSYELNNGNGRNNVHWNQFREIRAGSGSDKVIVLRDGDPVPDIAGAFSQASIAEYVDDYVDQSTNKMSLADNQVIYLYELGTGSDFQDLVVLLSLAEHPYEFNPVDDGTTNATILLGDPAQMHDNSTIDSYNPASAYGGTNVGPPPEMRTGTAMPNISAPNNLGSSLGHIDHQGNGTTNFHDSFRCDKLVIKDNHRVKIHGDIVIVTESEFMLQNDAIIELQPNATLTVFVLKDGYIQNRALLNDGGDPSDVTIINLAHTDFLVHNESRVFANFVSTPGTLRIQDRSEVFGGVLAQALYMQNESRLHVPGGSGDAGPTAISSTAEPAPSMTQRIELDRLNYLYDGRTHDLKIFFASRNNAASPLRLETNITTLNLAAAKPPVTWHAD